MTSVFASISAAFSRVQVAMRLERLGGPVKNTVDGPNGWLGEGFALLAADEAPRPA